MSKPLPQPLTLLTSKEAADYLKLSVRTLERMRVEGRGPQFLKAGRGIRSRVLYKQNDIEAWLQENSFTSTSEYS